MSTSAGGASPGDTGTAPPGTPPQPPGTPPQPQAGMGGRREYLWEVLATLWPPPTRVTRSGRRPPAGREVTTFLVVPHERNPVLLVPARPRRAAAAALRGYKASAALRDRVRFRAAALAAATGLAEALPDRISIVHEGPHGVSGRDPASPPAEPADIAGYLRAALGADLLVALHVGSPRANRKPVLQAITPAGEVAGFAKLGVSPLTAGLVRAEAAALDLLARAGLSHVQPPRLLHQGRWRGHEVLVQEAFPAARTARSVAELTAAMTEVARVGGVSRLPLAVSPYRRRLRARVAALAQPELAQPELAQRDWSVALMAVLDSVEHASAAGVLEFGSWHGDWTPWNMTMSGGRAQVWDWERFETGVPVGYDALHYRLQGDIIRGGAEPVTAAQAVLRQAAPILAPFGVEPASAGLVAALYLTEIAARYAHDGQAEAGARLGRLDTWLLPALTSHAQALTSHARTRCGPPPAPG